MKKWTLTTALLTLAVLGLMFSQAQNKKYTIVFIPSSLTDSFSITIHNGAKAAAAMLGVTLDLQGPPRFSLSNQIRFLNEVIARKPDAILIAPSDKKQLIDPLKKAADAGIKIITVDTFIGENDKYQTGKGDTDFPLAYLGSDNLEGGRIAARALAKAIGDKGSVYVSTSSPGISSTDQREQGFKEEMARHPSIKVLQSQYWDLDGTQATVMLDATPDLAGLFGTNPFLAMGPARVLKSTKKGSMVKVVSFDCPGDIVSEIKAGTIDIAICQHPAEMGQVSVEWAVKALKGEKIPTHWYTGYTVLDKSNINDPEALKFVYSSN